MRVDVRLLLPHLVTDLVLLIPWTQLYIPIRHQYFLLETALIPWT